MNKTVLFLCTGNYYRSRYAEHLFNYRAAQARLAWQAASRGLATELLASNAGPISMAAVERLATQGIPISGAQRWPQVCRTVDLAHADLVIALDEQEHRPYLSTRFPGWAERVEYWHVQDLHLASADEALALIDGAVTDLVQRLAQG